MAGGPDQTVTGTAQAKIRLLDSLRGWAALSVLVFHLFGAGVLPKFPGSDWFFYLQADRAAVLLFFVLSGYVIGLTNREPWSAGAVRAYGWRRFVRIYPVYLLAVALGWYAVPATSWQTVTGHLLFLQDSNPTNPLAVPNLPGNHPRWSLNYEALFYACFLVWWRWPATVGPSLAAAALAATAGTWFDPPPGVVITHAVGAIFWLSGLLLSRLPVSDQPARDGVLLGHILWLHAVYHFAPAYLLSRGLGLSGDHSVYLPIHDLVFLPGCVLLVAHAANRTLPGGRLWPALAGLTAASGLLMLLVARKNLIETRWLVCLAYLGGGALLFRVKRPLGLARLAGVGTISYALYVIHMPILVMLSRWFPATATWTEGWTAILLALGIVVPLAWWLECRFQPALRRLLTARAPS